MSDKIKILVLDDEETIRELAHEMLELLSFDVETAGSSYEAVECYRKAIEEGSPFDLVIFDINLQNDQNGFVTLAEIKKINPDIKAIAATGFISPDTEQHGEEAAVFDSIITKPYSITDLHDTIKHVLAI